MEEVNRVVVAAEHKDLVHDVAYDFYGKRMATCSSDHTVKVRSQSDTALSLTMYKVWDLADDGKTWVESAAFKVTTNRLPPP